MRNLRNIYIYIVHVVHPHRSTRRGFTTIKACTTGNPFLGRNYYKMASGGVLGL